MLFTHQVKTTKQCKNPQYASFALLEYPNRMLLASFSNLSGVLCVASCRILGACNLLSTFVSLFDVIHAMHCRGHADPHFKRGELLTTDDYTISLIHQDVLSNLRALVQYLLNRAFIVHWAENRIFSPGWDKDKTAPAGRAVKNGQYTTRNILDSSERH
jgi:hypothetical protein